MSKDNRPVLLPLGTGDGSTTVIYGEPSTSFAVLLAGECHFLVDLGYGVARQALHYLGSIPDNIYISHNHSDHAGDLPVVALRNAKQGKPITIWSEPRVGSRLKEHRLHEFRESGALPEDIAHWRAMPENVATALNSDFTLIPHQGLHSELCFGFLLRFRDQPLLGYSADSGFSPEFYRSLSEAPIVVLDGRLHATSEHAGFEEIEAFARSVPATRFFVTHYGRAEAAPTRLDYLRAGVPLQL